VKFYSNIQYNGIWRFSKFKNIWFEISKVVVENRKIFLKFFEILGPTF